MKPRPSVEPFEVSTPAQKPARSGQVRRKRNRRAEDLREGLIPRLEQLEGLALPPGLIVSRKMNAFVEWRVCVKPELDEGVRGGVFEALFPQDFERPDFRRVRVRHHARGELELELVGLMLEVAGDSADDRRGEKPQPRQKEQQDGRGGEIAE